MNSPPVICPRCRLIFPHWGFSMENGEVQFEGNYVQCPRCGYENAFVPDGIYYFGEAAREVARALSQQPGALAQAASLAKTAALGAITPEKAIAAAEAISFATGNLFRRVYKTLHDGLMIAAALTTIGAVFLDYQQDKSAEEAQRQTNEILSRIVAVQENQQRQSDEYIPRPRPRPEAYEERGIGDGPPKPRPNRHPRPNAGKRPK